MYNTQDYPDSSIISNFLYLDYYLKRRYFKGDTCHHEKSHTFIPNNVFKKFIYWAQEIIRKNNLESEKKEVVEEQKLKKEKPYT